ncbi:MAG: DMT family transporter [Saprospiraceae bacterium]
MKDTTRAYIELHIAVFLFGFTAILGDLIQLSALMLVWWRVLLTSISLLLLIQVRRMLQQIPREDLQRFMGIGILVGLHWICFYGAIKLANASIALIAMATTSFFTALLEPFLLRQRVKWLEIGLGILIIPGMILIANSTEFAKLTGLAVGLIAAMLAALFATLNKKWMRHYKVLEITFLELGTACLFLSLLLPIYFLITKESWIVLIPSSMDWLYLLVLSLLCTTLAYVLALRSLKHLSAFASNLTVNLEPVYGIALAWLILGENEELSAEFYWGVVIILLAVFSYPLLKRWIR